MRVLCCQCDGSCEAVVLFVDPCIEEGGVEESVRVVKQNLAQEEAEKDITA